MLILKVDEDGGYQIRGGGNKVYIHIVSMEWNRMESNVNRKPT
jgi:hypothetical protein